MKYIIKFIMIEQAPKAAQISKLPYQCLSFPRMKEKHRRTRILNSPLRSGPTGSIIPKSAFLIF